MTRRNRSWLKTAMVSLRRLAVLVGLLAAIKVDAAGDHRDVLAAIDARIDAVERDVIAWRRDIHQHPELANAERRTAALVAAHLESLGLEVQTEVAVTGVVATLRGARAGPTVALRADMDALPVREALDLPFASKATGVYQGETVPVMHACGHDAHTAMLMGAAQVLAGMRADLRGSVRFIFQPAEEGLPDGTRAGAALMVDEGVLDGVDAVIGLHVGPAPWGSIGYRAGGIMASADRFEIVVRGRQTHAAAPWSGIDPVVIGARIVLALQTLVSREVDLTRTPAVVSVGQFKAGVRNNIIPDRATLVGTIRTFDDATREALHAGLTRTAEHIARAAGGRATVTVRRDTPVTYNDPALTRRLIPTLRRVARDGISAEIDPTTTAEDFAFYQQRVPGLMFFLGVARPDDPNPAPNHSPRFYVDERALRVGVRAQVALVLDYLGNPPTPVRPRGAR